MEKNILLKYMEQRFLKSMAEEKPEKEPGPVITISRKTGCPANRIAKKLAAELNQECAEPKKKWRTVSKEILYESSKELNLDPSKIKYVFQFGKRELWDDILASMSTKYYKSDRKIRNTIADVIRTIANSGHVIIIGRGAVAITRDIPKSFHVNLDAPLEWRAEILCEKRGKPRKEMEEYIRENDLKRKEFRNSFYGKKTDYTRFDVSFNCMSFKDNEIVQAIVNMTKSRGLV